MASRTEIRERRIFLHAKHQKARQKVWCKPFDPEQQVNIPRFEKSSEESSFIEYVLKGNFVFSDLSDAEIHLLVNAFQKEAAKENDIVIQQGDTACEYFYVLQSGIVKFLVDGKEVFRCDNDGGAFGELELLYDFPRAATCQVVQDCVLWKLDQHTFRYILARYSVDQEKSASDLRQKSPLFSECDTEMLQSLAKVFTTVKFSKGDQIITKGDMGEVFYIILEGSVDVKDIGTGTSPHVDQKLGAGDWFGELEMRRGEPRVANVVAASETVVTLAMSKEDYHNSIEKNLQHVFDQEMRKRFLKALPIFSNSNSAFTDTELHLLVQKLEVKSYQMNDVIVDGSTDQGESSLWIIRQGNVSLFDGKTTHYLKRGDYFGDKWIDEAVRRPDHTSISARTARAVCNDDTSVFVLSRDDIEEVIGDMARLGASLPYQYPGLDTSIQLEDLQKHRVLGKGEFAVVFLASHKKTKKSYALKRLSKLHLLEHETNAVIAAKHEKEIMASVHHPFVMGMHASFQDKDYIYLVLPLFQGGELFSLIYKSDSSKYGLKPDNAVFYSACIVEALGCLHSRSIIYRDLKPDNVMIDSTGYAVIIDMGLAKVVAGKTYSMVGTPSYIAPEVLLGRGHNKAADYWALGCVLYETLEGCTPFYWEGASQNDEFRSILRCDYKCPSSFPSDATDLIQKLLVLEPTERLGSHTRGHLDVMSHPWFNPINFKELRQKRLPAPWVPAVKDSMDVSNFADFTEDVETTYRILTEKEQKQFIWF